MKMLGTEKLRTCCVCGEIGARVKAINDRSYTEVFNYGQLEDLVGGSDRPVCNSCWKKYKRLASQKQKADEIKKLINKLERTISHEHKNQNHR